MMIMPPHLIAPDETNRRLSKTVEVVAFLDSPGHQW